MDERIFLILVYIIQFIYILVGMWGLFGCKLIKKWVVIVFFIAYTVLIRVLPLTFLRKSIGYIGIIEFLLIYGSCLITIRSKKMNNILWLVYRLLSLIYIEELFFMRIDDAFKLCGIDTEGYKTYLLMNSINIVILILLVFLHKKYNNIFFSLDYMKKIQNKMIPLLVFFATEIMFLSIRINVWMGKRPDLFNRILGMLLGLLDMFSIGALVMFVLIIKRHNENLEELLAMEQQMKQYQKEYYTSLLDKETATRKYRHDMNSYLICLDQLADNGDIEGVKKYIKEMDHSMQEICSLTYQTGIDVLDVLVNHYCVYADESTIISVRGKCNGMIKASILDQCTIFSNLIQNALEALEYVSEKPKRFDIFIEEMKEQVQITFINSFNQQQISINKNGELETTKNDKINHGIGTLNVLDAVNKNSGTLYYFIRRNQFCCKVTLSKQ